MKTQIVHCLIASMSLLTLGCGGPADRPTTHPVAGVVTHNGNPVADAIVTFHAEEGNAPRSAMGKTDSKGHFRLTTFDTNDGAIAGRHIVTVVKTDAQAEQPAEMEIGGDAYAAAMAQAATGKDDLKSLIPEQYATKDESPLRVTVDEGGRDDVEIVLE